jgi:hypothetical protein
MGFIVVGRDIVLMGKDFGGGRRKSGGGVGHLQSVLANILIFTFKTPTSSI